MKNNMLITVVGSLVLGLTGCTDIPEPQYSNYNQNSYSSPTSSVDYGKMKNYCRGEAAGQFATKPMYVNVNDVHPRNNKYIVKGSADLGRDGNKPFKCVFDGNGNFVRFESLVNEGSL